MGDFYSSLFENLYGLDLSDYILGTLSPVQDANLYMNFGMVMLISTLVFGIVYYFVLATTGTFTTVVLCRKSRDSPPKKNRTALKSLIYFPLPASVK